MFSFFIYDTDYAGLEELKMEGWQDLQSLYLYFYMVYIQLVSELINEAFLSVLWLYAENHSTFIPKIEQIMSKWKENYMNYINFHQIKRTNYLTHIVMKFYMAFNNTYCLWEACIEMVKFSTMFCKRVT